MSNQKNTDTPQTLNVLTQFLKDLSFENPGNSNYSDHDADITPEININIQVNIQKLPQKEDQYFVDLVLKTISKKQDTPLFILDVTYTGLFKVTGFDEATQSQILNIQCPSILFPFIRRIVSEKIVDGGYPPLLIDPIDFYSLYIQNNEKQESIATN